MKEAFPRYGTNAKFIEASLAPEDIGLLKSFLDYCAVSAGDEQVNRHKRNILYFRDVIEKSLDSVTRDDAIKFWGLIKRAPYEEHTRISIRKSVKRFLKWHYKDLELIELLKIPKKHLVNKKRINKSTLLKPHELKLMLHKAEKIRDKALLVLLYETAARPQEVRELKWSHVNWNDKEIHFYSSKIADDRDLPVREALKHLKRWHDEWILPDPKGSDFVFPSSDGFTPDRNKPISTATINRVVQRAAKRAGITRNVFSYLFRHTRLTYIGKKGVTGQMRQKYAGQVPGSDQENVYLHMDNEDMKAEINTKVYGVDDPFLSQTSSQEQKIKELENQLQEALEFLQDFKKFGKEAMQNHGQFGE